VSPCSGWIGSTEGRATGLRSYASAIIARGSDGVTGQSEPKANVPPSSRRSRHRHPRLARTSPRRTDQLSDRSALVWCVQCTGCMLAITPRRANLCTVSSGTVSMCSMRCPAAQLGSDAGPFDGASGPHFGISLVPSRFPPTRPRHRPRQGSVGQAVEKLIDTVRQNVREISERVIGYLAMPMSSLQLLDDAVDECGPPKGAQPWDAHSGRAETCLVRSCSL
jgi:hypothetical protein